MRFGNAQDTPPPPASGGDTFDKTTTAADRQQQEEELTPHVLRRQIELMKQLDDEQRKQVYEALRLKYKGFWSYNLPTVGKALAAVVNGTIRLPLYLLKGTTSALNTMIPPTQRLYSTQDVDALLKRSESAGSVRTDNFVHAFKQVSDPGALERAIDESYFVQKLHQAVNTFGNNGMVDLQTMDRLVDRVEQAGPVDESIAAGVPVKTVFAQRPGGFTSLEELDLARILIKIFPLLAQLSPQPDTVSTQTVKIFAQNAKDSVPFLYDKYGQKAQKYVEANLYQLGVASAMPPLGGMKEATVSLGEKLNNYPTYRKIARWSKENQASDLQFLPFFSFADALYGQLVALTTGFVKDFNMTRVWKQMFELDGVFNGIGFFIAKWQILLAGWSKEKPDRLRAKYEKNLKVMSRTREELQTRLANARTDLEARIAANPSQREVLEREFQEQTVPAINRELAKLMRRMDKYQSELDKLIGVKKMGFFEKAWKQPPEYFNDMKYIIPIGLALGIPYELLWFNRYVGVPVDFFSLKFLYYNLYGVPLSVASNLVVKQVIHLTQDRTKLYQHGKKDELMAIRTRKFLANLKGLVDELKAAPGQDKQQLAQRLEAFYNGMALPLIGDESQQNTTEKTLNREAKLNYSMASSDTIKAQIARLHEHLVQASRGAGYKPAKAFRKYLKMLLKIHERLAYAPISSTKFDLELLGAIYTKEFKAFGMDRQVPRHFTEFLENTIKQTEEFLAELGKKYPKAELLFEPLLLKSTENGRKMQEMFEDNLLACEEWITDIKKQRGALGWTILKGKQARQDKETLTDVLKVLKTVRSGLLRDIYYLTAKSKDEASRELEDYRTMRTQYAQATSQMAFGPTRLGRYLVQAGMAVKQAFKKAAWLDKYNNWFTGYPWIPVHSMLNVVGRFGLASIILEKILPIEVLFKIWLTNHIPIRIYAFLNEKFLVLRDLHRHKRSDTEKALENGVEQYIQKLIADKKKAAPKPDATAPKTDTHAQNTGTGGNPLLPGGVLKKDPSAA